MNYIAYCTKGLEQVVVSELQIIANPIQIQEGGSKRVVFQTRADPKTLLKLRTVDDLGVLVEIINSVETLQDIVEKIDSIDFEKLRKDIHVLRPLNTTFSLTASMTGVKVFTSSELLQAVSARIQNAYGWDYTERDHTNFDLRIFIDQTKAYLSIRLTKESLHNRTYKINATKGSLKPTVAAAMIYMATGGKSHKKIVDSFCGSGTILCEAYLQGHEIYGGDINNESITITQTNLEQLRYKKQTVKQVDAIKTSWQTNYFDCAISNLPWDKQIKVTSITDVYKNSLQEYKRILKPDGTLCLLVTKPELLIKHARIIFPNAHIKEYKLGLLGQIPSIVLIQN